jgi:integrase/recombinase XerD
VAVQCKRAVPTFSRRHDADQIRPKEANMAAVNLPDFSPANDEVISRFVRFLTVERGLSSLTIGAYRADLLQLSQSLSRPLVTGGRREIGEHIEKLLGEQLPRSVRRKVSVFREFYKFLLLDGVIPSDPMARIESPKVGRVLPKGLLSESEMATVLETLRPHCKTRPAERMRLRDRAALELLYGSGLRVTELVTAQVADVNLADRCIRVHGKRDKERIAPFGHCAAEALREYLAPRALAIASLNEELKVLQADEEAETKIRKKQMQIVGATLWLFPGRQGRPLTRERAWQLVHRRFQQIGCDVSPRTLTPLEPQGASGKATRPRRNISPHALRHACATHMMENGANLRIVQEVLGHANISTTEIYLHASIKSVREIYLRCHPRATGKSRQLKLQLDLLPAELLTAGPVLCSECGRVAQPGKVRCEFHLQKVQERQERKRKDGICISCGSPAVAGKVRCELHLSKDRESSRLYHAKKQREAGRLFQERAKVTSAPETAPLPSGRVLRAARQAGRRSA